MVKGRGACRECRGSGQCESCYGSGTNLDFCDLEPQCIACGGMRRCQSCKGNGLSSDSSSFRDAPLSLRVALSTIPVFFLYRILIASEPVHSGRGGQIMPRAGGWLATIAVCVPVLYGLWKDVKLSDFDFCNNSSLSILDRYSKDPSVPVASDE